MNDFIKHGAEFLRAIRNHKWERTDDGGIFFPEAKAVGHGVYVHDVNGQDVRYDKNILPVQGLTHLLGVEYNAVTHVGTWYFALYSGAVTPDSTITASNAVSTLTEITSTSEGYSGGNRIAWVPGTAASGSIDNLASKASYTIVTASNVTVNGAFMTSAQARAATTGFVASASRFGSARVLSNTDIFNLGYTISLTSS